jgi:hypothetical protein
MTPGTSRHRRRAYCPDHYGVIGTGHHIARTADQIRHPLEGNGIDTADDRAGATCDRPAAVDGHVEITSTGESNCPAPAHVAPVCRPLPTAAPRAGAEPIDFYVQ